ncbi:peptidoglycan-binding protein [Lentzea rhizosphaerae]|uniref:Peptidoglycan-binding protein n=1 Tax=Lentzea rhizosphaerae TaxID=2041025 RepID=A0ABV8BJX6_9PSEU
MKPNLGPLRRAGLGIAAVALAVSGMAVSTGSASAATPLCQKMITYVNAAGNRIVVPATNTNSTTCNIGSDLVANTAVVAGLQRGLIQCYPGVRLAAPYGNEFVRDLDRDGSFGPRTEAAVKGVQKYVRSAPDGIYGPNTRDRMKFPSGTTCKPYRV